MKSVVTTTLACLLGLVCSIVIADSPAEIYQRRILPLLRSSHASSCNECHLQSIDLKQFLHEDPQQTFSELRARGWIDVDRPEKSKLLEFISRVPDESSEIQRKVRDAEFEAMHVWIQAAVKDPSLLAIPLATLDDLGFDRALALHSRADQITERFVIAIWSQLERCANCHSPDRNQKRRDEHGESMSWIVPRSPSKTLELLLERKLIDLEKPASSLLRLKAIGGDSHGGGIKFPEGGKTDANWLAFLTDHSKTLKGNYRSAAELPRPLEQRGWRSGLHLRIVNVPSEWNDHLLQVTLHRRLEDGTFAETPTAWAESRVSSERRSWGNSLSILSDTDSRRRDSSSPIELSVALPNEIYEARVFSVESPIDAGRTWSSQRVAGSFEIAAPWPAGHSSAKQIEFSSIRLK